MNGNPKMLKGTEFSTVRLDVAMFIRRWRRVMSQGKAGSALRVIKRGESSTTLTIEQIESLLKQAEAYHQIRDVIMQHRDLKPIERYSMIRNLIKITDEGVHQ